MNNRIDGNTAPRACLENLKSQAKSLLKQAKTGNPHATRRLLRAKVIKEKAPIKLADAQLAIARENGCSTWLELKAKVEKEGSPIIHRKLEPSIKGIDQIWFDCLDLEKTKVFYAEILGLYQSGEVPGQMLFLECDGINLLLGHRNEVRPNSILYFKIGNSECL